MKSLVSYINESLMSVGQKKQCLNVIEKALHQWMKDNGYTDEDDDKLKEYAEMISDELSSYKSDKKLADDIKNKSDKLKNFLEFADRCKQIQDDVVVCPVLTAKVMNNLAYVNADIDNAVAKEFKNL